MNRVFIALATYNGAAYLGPLLESLRRQSYAGWTLLARDDGSTDATVEILCDAAAGDRRIVVLRDDLGRRGPAANFGLVMERACDRGAEYVVLADQDDVWLPDKIARTLARMRDLERRLGADRPLLVHTDLAVVDASLRPLGRSLWEYQHLDVRRGGSLNRLLLQNVVTGCAAMLNRPLVQRALPIPTEAVMHDWWVALVAAALGRVEPLPGATLLYRQHGRNLFGAKRWDGAHVIRRVRALFDRGVLRENLRASQRQAWALADRYGPLLPAAKRCAIEAYADLGACGFFERRWRLARYGFCRPGWLRNLSLFAKI